MNWIISIGAMLFVLSSIVLVLLVRSASTVDLSLHVTVDWLNGLSIESYLPMSRLLNEQDLWFLKSQPGYTPEIARRVRSVRCRIFVTYLNRLEADFQRVTLALKILILQSRCDRPELASLLVRQQISFAVGMLLVRTRLCLYRWGLGSVDVTGVLRIFDIMQLELRTLVPVASQAGI
jgi:hypothetical protein